MKRRESIKSLIVGSVASGLVLQGCQTESKEEVASSKILKPGRGYGRTPEEAKRDDRIMSETFFMPFEMATIAILVDIIIPADETSGAASEAGVPDFIEFIVKDYPDYQQPMRSGLGWLNLTAKDRFGFVFMDASPEQQLALVEDIASDVKLKDQPELKPGVEFFNLIRNLTATGFFTSKMGVKDLGYEGNVPNVWDGVPDEVMEKHGFAYDEDKLALYVKLEDRDKLPEWDEEGNLVG